MLLSTIFWQKLALKSHVLSFTPEKVKKVSFIIWMQAEPLLWKHWTRSEISLHTKDTSVKVHQNFSFLWWILSLSNIILVRICCIILRFCHQIYLFIYSSKQGKLIENYRKKNVLIIYIACAIFRADHSQASCKWQYIIVTASSFHFTAVFLCCVFSTIVCLSGFHTVKSNLLVNAVKTEEE